MAERAVFGTCWFKISKNKTKLKTTTIKIKKAVQFTGWLKSK
jgi:hypothetical protein